MQCIGCTTTEGKILDAEKEQFGVRTFSSMFCEGISQCLIVQISEIGNVWGQVVDSCFLTIVV